MLYFDVDRLKVVNDSLGHATGDMLLVQIAERVHRMLRSTDVLARLGGDEFTMLLDKLRSNGEAVVIAERVAESFVEPFRVGGRSINVSASIGVATNLDTTDDAETLLSFADAAQYRAKQSGRNRIEVFDIKLRAAIESRLDDEHALRDAIAHEQIVAWFQPEVDLRTGLFVGAEALARWDHPERGVLDAWKFVPLAEETGLVFALDDAIVASAVTTRVQLAADGFGDGFRIWCNVSATHLTRSAPTRRLADLLERTGCVHLYAQAAYPIRERVALYNLENHICGGRLQAECSAATPAQQSHLDSLNAQIAAIHINLDSVRKVNGGIRLDSISNGADDDGSGTVTLLEIAEKFAKSKPDTKRSMLFVWHVGEEKGLWGSQYITDHPPVPRDSIVAQLNMDMVGRGAASDLFEGGPNYVQLVGGRRVSTELGDIVEAQNKKLAHPFTFDYQYDANGHPENIYCRSDHFNYARYGIPIVFVTTGLHGDYHQVTDEPEYIDYPHMAKIGNFMYDLGAYVADLDHRPKVDHPVGDPKARCRQ